MPMASAISSASSSVRPCAGSMNTLRIFSGVLAATSSMSMPPSADAISTTRCVPRSTTMPAYISFLISAPSSTRSRLTFCPAGPVWCVLSCMPRISSPRAHLVQRSLDLPAAALAAAAGVDLRLHHPDLAAELLCRFHRLVDAHRREAARRRHAVLPEDLLPLVLVNFQAAFPLYHFGYQ